MAYIKDKIELEAAQLHLDTTQTLSQFPWYVKWPVIFGVIALVPGYFIAKQISYRIEKSTLKQYEIAAKPSFENPQSLNISPVTLTTAGPNTYSAFATVTNPNVDLAADNVSYVFRFYNASHQVIEQTITGTTFFLPNQKQSIIAPRIVTAEPIADADLSFPQQPNWQKRFSIPEVSLITEQPQTFNQSDPVAFVVQGTVFNNSPYQVSQTTISFVLYNGSGQIVATSQRTEFTLKPFERRAYTQLWPGIQTSNVARTEVNAVTDTLNSDNLQLANSASPASNLNRPETK